MNSPCYSLNPTTLISRTNKQKHCFFLPFFSFGDNLVHRQHLFPVRKVPTYSPAWRAKTTKSVIFVSFCKSALWTGRGKQLVHHSFVSELAWEHNFKLPKVEQNIWNFWQLVMNEPILDKLLFSVRALKKVTSAQFCSWTMTTNKSKVLKYIWRR